MNPDSPKHTLHNPTETLQCELKSWVSLDVPEDRAKIAKALLSLRNRDGGRLIFGIDDKTLAPAPNRPVDIRTAYHADKLQGIVQDFSQPAFPLELQFAEWNGLDYPVVVVPPGIAFPVIARQDFKAAGGTSILRQGRVYMRTVHSGCVSSAEPTTPEDWKELLDICFDNREADVARFLRRNLGPMLAELGLRPGATVLPPPIPVELEKRGGETEKPAPTAPPPATTSTDAPSASAIVVAPRWVSPRNPVELLDEGDRDFRQRLAHMREKSPAVKIPDYRAWREISVIIDGEIKPLGGQHLLHAIFPRHPQMSGWPLWLDSRPFGADAEKPYPHNSGWEALYTADLPAMFASPVVDFWRMDPRGEFYHRRSLEDDLWARIPDEGRGKKLDFVNTVKRVAEALGTIQAFTHGMAVNPESCTLRAAFRWTNLEGRKLVSFEPGRDIWANVAAYEDTIVSTVEMPVSTAPGAVAGYVEAAAKPLFSAFGYALPTPIFEELTTKVLLRRDG